MLIASVCVGCQEHMLSHGDQGIISMSAVWVWEIDVNAIFIFLYFLHASSIGCLGAGEPDLPSFAMISVLQNWKNLSQYVNSGWFK